ncbi:MAG TPA: glycosyltransferase family 4 protein [Acidimicrobiales bacterium]|nr:glycosyltransferase family 4 protein [Acidimicrobiales bacterium]
MTSRQAQLRINLVLPHLKDQIIGGYKIMYQYANELDRLGHRVTVVHPIRDDAPLGPRSWTRWSRHWLDSRLRGRPPVKWFDFEPGVRFHVQPCASARLPEADVTLLSGWQTATARPVLSSASGIAFQLVHDYEIWMDEPELRPRISAAMRRPEIRRLVPSRAVGAMLTEIGTDWFAEVADGLVEGDFAVDADIRSRRPLVGFPWRDQESKDMATALEVAHLVRAAVPDAEIVCYGETRVPPAGVVALGRVSPDELRRFYNECAVFLVTSRYEGFGLPALEAMRCGAALVTTRNGGVEDFARPGDTALLADVGAVAELSRHVVALLNDGPKRAELAERGVAAASRLTLGASGRQIERLFASAIERDVAPPPG